MLLIPSQAFPGAWQLEIVGGVLTAVLVGREVMAKRRLQAA